MTLDPMKQLNHNETTVKRSALLNTSCDSIKIMFEIMLDDTLETALWDTVHSVLWLYIMEACV